MMPKASELMREPKVIATPDQKLSEVLPKMRENKEWVIPVRSKGILVGVLSYKDLLRRRVSDQAKVMSVMEPPFYLIDEDDETRIIAKFFNTKARAIPVLNTEKKIKGIITREDVLSYFFDKLPESTTREYMSSPPITVEENDSVAKARWILVRDNVSRIPVTKEGKVTGIITTRDIVDRLYSVSGRKRADLMVEEERIMAAPVKDIMTYPVFTVQGAQSLKKTVREMIDRKVSGLPVLEGDRLAGVISTIDALKGLGSLMQMSLPIEAKLTQSLRSAEKKSMIDGIVERYISKLERLTDINSFKVSFKESKAEGFRVSATITTKIGTFISTYNDRDPAVAVRGAMERLEKRILKKLKLIESGNKGKGTEEP